MMPTHKKALKLSGASFTARCATSSPSILSRFASAVAIFGLVVAQSLYARARRQSSSG